MCKAFGILHTRSPKLDGGGIFRNLRRAAAAELSWILFCPGPGMQVERIKNDVFSSPSKTGGVRKGEASECEVKGRGTFIHELCQPHFSTAGEDW